MGGGVHNPLGIASSAHIRRLVVNSNILCVGCQRRRATNLDIGASRSKRRIHLAESCLFFTSSDFRNLLAFLVILYSFKLLMMKSLLRWRAGRGFLGSTFRLSMGGIAS